MCIRDSSWPGGIRVLRRALICATRLRSLRRAAKHGCRQATNLRNRVIAKRMSANFSRENIVRFPTMIDARVDRHSPANPVGATAVSSRLYDFQSPVHALSFDHYQLPLKTGLALATNAS